MRRQRLKRHGLPTVYGNSPRGSPFEQQALASILKYIDALAATDVAAAVEAGLIAARSALKEQAVASVLKHVDALAAVDVTAATDAVRGAYDESPSDSPLKQQVLAKLLELGNLRVPPKPDEAAAKAFAQRAHAASNIGFPEERLRRPQLMVDEILQAFDLVTERVVDRLGVEFAGVPNRL
jgi:hypothetical protein